MPKRVIELYNDCGLTLAKAEDAVEAVIFAVWQRLSSGRLKVFRSCRNLIAEMRLYRRDDNGKVVEENDHACDALRYAVMSGLKKADVKTAPETEEQMYVANGWMGR